MFETFVEFWTLITWLVWEVEWFGFGELTKSQLEMEWDLCVALDTIDSLIGGGQLAHPMGSLWLSALLRSYDSLYLAGAK